MIERQGLCVSLLQRKNQLVISNILSFYSTSERMESTCQIIRYSTIILDSATYSTVIRLDYIIFFYNQVQNTDDSFTFVPPHKLSWKQTHRVEVFPVPLLYHFRATLENFLSITRLQQYRTSPAHFLVEGLSGVRCRQMKATLTCLSICSLPYIQITT